MPDAGKEEAVNRSRSTDEQIVYALQLAESGTPVINVCRQTGISEATSYAWKKKYALGVTELRKLKQLEDENARLKRIVADLTLDKQILQEVVRRIPWRPPNGASWRSGCRSDSGSACSGHAGCRCCSGGMVRAGPGARPERSSPILR
jgi:putative transposase